MFLRILKKDDLERSGISSGVNILTTFTGAIKFKDIIWNFNASSQHKP